MTDSKGPAPLLPYQGKPFVGFSRPGFRYVGRLVVELFEYTDPTDPSKASPAGDANSIAMQCDAVDGDYAEVTRRIAAALPIRVARDKPFEKRP